MTMLEPLAATLAAQLFPATLHAEVGAPLLRLLALAQWRRQEFATGPLRQAILCVLCDPVADMARASVRLQLRDGPVYALSASGAPARIVDSLVEIGTLLDGLRGDQATHHDNELLLARVLPAAGIAGVALAPELSGTLLPAPPLGSAMLGKLVLHGLNRLLSRYRQPQLQVLPAVMSVVVADMVSVRQPLVDAYERLLNQAARDFSRRVVIAREQLCVYNFLTAGNGLFCRNRLQAVQTLPWLLMALAKPVFQSPARGARLLAENWPARSRQIIKGIDEGEPLFDTVAAVLNVSRATVRWLGSRPLPRPWLMDLRRAELLHRLLSWLPPEKRPSDVSGLGRMVDFGNIVLAALQGISDLERVPDLGRPQYSRIVRRWSTELAQRQTLMDAYRSGLLQRELHDSHGFLLALFGAMLHRCGADEVQVLAQLLDHLCEFSLTRLLAQSRAWHAALQRWDVGMPRRSKGRNSADGADWPLVLPEPQRHGERIVVELANAQALIAEGHNMRHCVGGYAEQCASGDCLIFSVADTTGLAMSTVLLNLVGAGERVVLGQHRGSGNAEPAAACEEAVAALLTWLNREEQGGLRVARYRSQEKHRADRQGRQRALRVEEALYVQRSQDLAWKVFTLRRCGSGP